MIRTIALAAFGLTLAACDTSDRDLGTTDGCGGEVSPHLEDQSLPVRCGPQYQSPSDTGTDIAVPGEAG